MVKAYQYDASGYFAGEVEDYGLLPNNATYTLPKLQDGYIPHWNGNAWDLIENHKGKQGYVDGQPYTVKDYGPLPTGWSDTPPLPTLDEARAAKLSAIDEQTSAAILAGFDYAVDKGDTLHFSYDAFDQQNFADTANACLMLKAGAQGLPNSVTWNAYRGEARELTRLTLTTDQFLSLYAGGALAHKAVQMEEGGRRKQAVEAATSVEEVEAV